MMFYSTNNRGLRATLREAVLGGLAPDGGLYMPCEIPTVEWDPAVDFHEHAFRLARPYLAGDLSDDAIRRLVVETLAFDAPVVPLTNQISVLELFHGPTCAFKDFGARFMARLVRAFAEEDGRERTVLVATSGDTGSAVAHGFFNVPGTRVVILYPGGKVSDIQEKQLTTMGGNVTALEIDGTFDDCQRLVKRAFVDRDLLRANLTSANSINVARLIPQTFYFANAAAQFAVQHSSFNIRHSTFSLPVISVPSGNFGNLVAGLIAKRMGVPIGRFIAATNANDVVPEYLATGSFRPRPSVETLSNAMDVGNPSNFARILELYGHDVERVRRDVVGYRVTDDETRDAMQELRASFGYAADPHGAVGFAALLRCLDENPGAAGLFLETAHPAKFGGADVPPRLAACLGRRKVSVPLPASYEELKAWMLAR